MNGLAASPLRNLVAIVAFVVVVVMLATAAYMYAGWSLTDASYMVLLTVFTVGYGEVHPINTAYLHSVTVATMLLGCTGMILLTGALVQALTFVQLREILGGRSMTREIEKLKDHVVVCGFGRIGVMLARELAAGGAPFVVIERDEGRLAQAREAGYLCHQGDATDEQALIAGGVERARCLATVLPDDAANVFITLSARSLNRGLKIIARGELPSTQSKLVQAGADEVVLPTHIGAERIAEMILFPGLRGSSAARSRCGISRRFSVTWAWKWKWPWSTTRALPWASPSRTWSAGARAPSSWSRLTRRTARPSPAHRPRPASPPATACSSWDASAAN